MIVGGGQRRPLPCIVPTRRGKVFQGAGVRLTAVISAMVLVVCAGLSTFAWTQRPADRSQAATGMDILRAYRCRRGETKSIIIRGVEDQHSAAGDEPNFVRAGRHFPDTLTFVAGGSYDQVEADRRMTDSFKVPANTADGLFLIGLKAVANNDSDTIGIGDFNTLASSAPVGKRFSAAVSGLEQLPGWSRQGDLYFAELSGIGLYRGSDPNTKTPGRTLLDLVRSNPDDGWVDVLVQDDTSVDFIGVAVCQEPPREKGLTLAPWVGEPLRVDGVVALTCSFGGRDQANCDPYLGDTPCETRLPVACFRPLATAMPRQLKTHFARTIWSGGRLAFTGSEAGSRFATAGQVDAFCASRFGSDWRAATLHDGMNNLGIAGFGEAASLSSRVWIDVAGSPYATCWAADE